MALFYPQTSIKLPNSDRTFETTIRSPHATLAELTDDIRAHGVALVEKVRVQLKRGEEVVSVIEEIAIGASYIGFIQNHRPRQRQ
jgi:hypothetical protein